MNDRDFDFTEKVNNLRDLIPKTFNDDGKAAEKLDYRCQCLCTEQEDLILLGLHSAAK